MTLSKKCDSCNNVYNSKVSSKTIKCDKCKKEHFFFNSKNLIFERCSFCNCKEFYKRKDFNQKLGCLFVLIGSLLLPFTYGISLVFVLIIDMIFYKYVDEVIVCYKCKMEFRGFKKISKSIKLFDHHTAELYDKYWFIWI